MFFFSYKSAKYLILAYILSPTIASNALLESRKTKLNLVKSMCTSFFYPSELVPHSLHVWIYCLYSLLSFYRYINEIWITIKTIKTKIIENLNCWPELKRQKKVKIMKVNQFWKTLTDIFIGWTLRMFTHLAGGYFACCYFLKKTIQLCKSCNIYYKDCMGYHLRV